MLTLARMSDAAGERFIAAPPYSGWI